MTDETREARIKELLSGHGDPLLLHDWYFEACQEDQRRACFYYEYLREAQREGRIDLADWEAAINYDIFTEEYDPKKAERWFAAQKQLGRKIQRPSYTHDWVQGLIRAPWPDKPWLDLDADERKRRMKRYAPPRTDFGRLKGGLSKSALASIATLPMQPWQVWGVVRFDKGVTVEELNESFATEVRGLAKTQPELFEERGKGRAGWLSRLQKLGARRLRGLKQHFKSHGEKFTDQDVIAYCKLRLRKLHGYVGGVFFYVKPYGRPSELISAARNAGTILDSLVPKKVCQ